MLLHGVVRDAAVGESIEVIASDPSTQRDIPKFCNFLNHPLLSQTEKDGLYYYRLKKGQ